MRILIDDTFPDHPFYRHFRVAYADNDKVVCIDQHEDDRKYGYFNVTIPEWHQHDAIGVVFAELDVHLHPSMRPELAAFAQEKAYVILDEGENVLAMHGLIHRLLEAFQCDAYYKANT